MWDPWHLRVYGLKPWEMRRLTADELERIGDDMSQSMRARK